MRALTLTMLAGAVGLVACGGDDGSGPPASGRRTVIVANNEFQPANVTIEVGDTILWSWASTGVDHNILSNGGLFQDKGDSVGAQTGTDLFNAPASHQVIFDNAGVYRYFCSAHGTGGATNTGMSGTITVN